MELVNQNITCIFESFAKGEIDETTIRYKLQNKLKENQAEYHYLIPIHLL